MKLPKFLIGFLIGGLLGIIFWYWQKSTSAEDGALSVLDRLAQSEARVRDLEARLRMAAVQDPGGYIPVPTKEAIDSVQPATEEAAEDLREIDGIGPTYASRLEEAGINTFAALAKASPEKLQDVAKVRSYAEAASWIEAAQNRIV